MLSGENLAAIRTIDLTTRGRRTGRQRTVEIWWFHVDGRFIISGTPGRRDWLANVRSDPRVIIGANGHEIEATAEGVTDPGFRRRFFTDSKTSWYSSQSELERLIESAPMIEVNLPTTR